MSSRFSGNSETYALELLLEGKLLLVGHEYSTVVMFLQGVNT